jgi:hypothetical protein
MMSLDDIALDLARSMFICSDKHQSLKEPWLFMFHIDDWVRLEQSWISMNQTEKMNLVEDAKKHLEMLESNFPLVYDIIVNRIIFANDKSIDHLLHGSSI